MTAESGAGTIEADLRAVKIERTRRTRVHLAAAGVVVALAAGVGGVAAVGGDAEPTGAALPAVVLGESLEPVPVYERGDDGVLSADPVATLHVRFAMLRHGPGPSNWTLTLVAPEEAPSAVSEVGTRRHLVVRFDGNEYLLGLSYPADDGGRAVDFFAILNDRAGALDLARAVTTSTVEGPPMGAG